MKIDPTDEQLAAACVEAMVQVAFFEERKSPLDEGGRRGGAGYYWYDAEYPEEGFCGPRASRRAAQIDALKTLGACLFCGCTDDRACEVPCSWLEPHRCSNHPAPGEIQAVEGA